MSDNTFRLRDTLYPRADRCIMMRQDGQLIELSQAGRAISADLPPGTYWWAQHTLHRLIVIERIIVSPQGIVEISTYLYSNKDSYVDVVEACANLGTVPPALFVWLERFMA